MPKVKPEVKAKAKAKAKDRSLRQLLQLDCIAPVGAAEGCDLCF
jgi:hypothetical protein